MVRIGSWLRKNAVPGYQTDVLLRLWGFSAQTGVIGNLEAL